MKKFKKVICFIATICVVFSLFMIPVFADTYVTGSTLVSFIQCTNVNTSYICLSNITDSPVHVAIIAYDSDGSMITDDGSIATGLVKCVTPPGVTVSDYRDQNFDSTVDFRLNGHSTCTISIGDNSTFKYGYAEIQWTQLDSSVSNALMGYVIWSRVDTANNQYTRTPLAINGGLPF